MSSLFVIINPYDDIIYSKAFQNTEKEYLTMFMIAYSCVDHFTELRKHGDDFFPCIEKHFCWDVTTYFLRNGMCFILIHQQKCAQRVICFFEAIELVLTPIFLSSTYCNKTYIIDKYFEELVENKHRENFQY